VQNAEIDIDNLQINIGTLNTNIGTINANIGSLSGRIDDIDLDINGLRLATNASKLEFNSNGLTIYNGGSTTLLSSTSGSLYLRGELRTGYVTIDGTGVWVTPSTYWDGSPSGGRLYFDSSNSRMILQALGWSVLIRTSQLSYLLSGNNKHIFTGNVDIIGSLLINGEAFVKKRLSEVQSYHYVLSYY